MRYKLRKLESGWAVWDKQTNTPAAVGGRWQTDLAREDAGDLVDLLNKMEQGKEKPAG